MAPKKKTARKKSAGQRAAKTGSGKKATRKISSLKRASKKRPRDRGDAKDLRRAFEHLHRVSFLHDRLDSNAKQQVDALSRAAQTAIAADQPASAADFLRAAEHLAFASLAASTGDKNASEMLVGAARAQYENLVDRASDHWEHHDETSESELASLFHHLLGAAEEAYAAGALYRALEFARGAEALAHTKPGKRRKVSAGKVKAAKETLA